MWPQEVKVMFDIQSSASSFSDQLMDFDCEMAKRADEMRIFLQRQIFYAVLPAALLFFNTVFWIFHERFNGCRKCLYKSKVDHVVVNLSKKRLARFKNLAKRARDSKRDSNSALDVIRRAH